jgi:hypothetical protein
MMTPILCSAESSVPEDTLEQLESIIQGRLRGRIDDFRLLLRDEGLVLHGRTRTYYVKQLAQTELMAISNYLVVANEIEVH